MVKGKIVLCLWLVAMLVAGPWMVRDARAESEPPDVSAESAVMIDVQSGRVLYRKNAEEPRLIASLTKIMTAITAIEHARDLDRSLTIPDDAVGTEGSSIYLKQDETLTLRQLLFGLMLRSGNDAAVAIANAVGGSMEGFAFMMNQKAAYLGMQDTHFTNPHGLDDGDRHYSTARDMAKLTAYALQNPIFQEIVSTEHKAVPYQDDARGRTWRNKNKMLQKYEGADGVKTGYTKQAGRCLVSSATKDGRQLAVVTLDAPDDWRDHQALFDYGFETYDTAVIVKAKQAVNTLDMGRTPVTLVAKNRFAYPLTFNERTKVRAEVVWEKDMWNTGRGSVHDVWGYLRVYLEGETIGSIPLILAETEETSMREDKGLIAYIRSYWQTAFTFGGR